MKSILNKVVGWYKTYRENAAKRKAYQEKVDEMFWCKHCKYCFQECWDFYLCTSPKRKNNDAIDPYAYCCKNAEPIEDEKEEI